MSREAWRAFLCSSERSGRHLSSIGRGVISSSASDPIDLPVLQAFLDRLHHATDDVRVLADVIDLVRTPYLDFAQQKLHRILDALSNEMKASEQVVGPGLRGNPRWDRTIIRRMAGTLSRVHYVSRTAHRSFDLPENLLLAWLAEHLRHKVLMLGNRIGTQALHPNLQALRSECEEAQRHHWFGDLTPPPEVSDSMIKAAERHRREEYRAAAQLVRRRQQFTTDDHGAWWYSMLQFLAVDWLEPIGDDDLFELYVLVLVLDVLMEELGLGEPVEYGLVIAGRGHVALFETESLKVRVYFDQAPATILDKATEFQRVRMTHEGVSGGERRPDVIVVAERDGMQTITLIEAKKTSDGRYTNDSIYKVFAYLYDFRELAEEQAVRALLVVPTGIAPIGRAAAQELYIVSGDDRPAVSNALSKALFAGLTH